MKEKIGVIIKTLKGFEIGDVFVIPIIRELLDKSGNCSRNMERELREMVHEQI